MPVLVLALVWGVAARPAAGASVPPVATPAGNGAVGAAAATPPANAGALGPAGDAGAGEDAAALGGQQVTLLDYIHAGGVVSYVLIVISVVALALIVRNILVLRMKMLAPPDLVRTVDMLLASGRLEEAAALCQKSDPPSFLSKTLGRAFARTSGSALGALEFRGALEEAAQTESDELHRLNDGLGIIAAIGPMLGLLGTVFGMIGAFRTIGALEGAARSNQLSLFMSMALVNTAQGLIVAVPCTIAYALFRRHIDRSLMRIGDVLERAVKMVTQQAGGVGAVRAAGPVGGAAGAPVARPVAPAALPATGASVAPTAAGGVRPVAGVPGAVVPGAVGGAVGGAIGGAGA
jgi:biopolymer transport protein ExbB